MIRAVLVDLGDTLVHLNRNWDDVFQENLESLYACLKEAGLDLSFQEFGKVFIHGFEDASTVSHFYKIEIPIEEIMSKVFDKVKLRNVDGSLIHRAMMEFYKPEIDAWQLYPDTLETLNSLKENGFELGLISNSKSEWAVHAILDKFDLHKFFQVIVTSAAMKIRKPSPGIFKEALTALSVTPQETVFVGDSLQADVIGARIAGIRAIHVLRKPDGHQSLMVPDISVGCLKDAVNKIATWNNASAESIKSSPT